jgi:hypothetical protein
MNRWKHIAPDAVALAALPLTSLQRQAAEAHASGCPDCARALRQGERVLELFDAQLDFPAPSEAALRLAMKRTRRVAALHIAGPTAVTVLALAAVLAAVGSVPGEGWRWAASAALAIGGVALSWLAISGRTVRWTVAAAALFSLVFSVAFAGSGPLSPLLGVRCCFVELVPVVIGLATLFVLGQLPAIRDPWRAVALAGASGLTVQAALLVCCPARMGALHMLAFHSGGLFAICAAAAWLAPRLAQRAGAPIQT